MKLGMILMSLAAVAWLGACSDSTDPEPVDSDLRGQVVDAQGQPVAGATVVLQYEVDPPIGNMYDKPATTIRIDLPPTGPVTLWIGSFCDGDTVRMILDGESPGHGQFEIVWDGKDDADRTMPDGVYRCHLLTTAGESHTPFLLLHLGYQLPEAADLAPLAVTDAQGRFTLSQACLPLGFGLDSVDEDGEVIGTNTVTRSVRVWTYDPQSGILDIGPMVTVDPATGAEVTVTIGD